MNTPTNRSVAEALHIHELAEAQTALGLYLSALKRIVGGDPGPSDPRLQEIVNACIKQSDRAAEALKGLRRLLLDRQHGDGHIGGS